MSAIAIKNVKISDLALAAEATILLNAADAAVGGSDGLTSTEEVDAYLAANPTVADSISADLRGALTTALQPPAATPAIATPPVANDDATIFAALRRNIGVIATDAEALSGKDYHGSHVTAEEVSARLKRAAALIDTRVTTTNTVLIGDVNAATIRIDAVAYDDGSTAINTPSLLAIPDDASLDLRASIIKAEIAGLNAAVDLVNGKTFSESYAAPEVARQLQHNFNRVQWHVTSLMRSATTPQQIDAVKRIVGAYNTAVRNCGSIRYTIAYSDNRTRDLPLAALPERIVYPQP